jgi:chaperonin cofactor prefoldin
MRFIIQYNKQRVNLKPHQVIDLIYEECEELRNLPYDNEFYKKLGWVLIERPTQKDAIEAIVGMMASLEDGKAEEWDIHGFKFSIEKE